MMLYDNPRNDDHKRRMNIGLYLAPEETQMSENTSSMYAYVKVYDDEDCRRYLADGWISLGSDNFVVDNY